MSTQPKTFLTPEEYLEIERQAEFKSEYYNGEMFAISGGSPKHNIITLNVSTALWAQLRHKACLVFTSDVRLRVLPSGLYTYPEVMVVCGEPRYADDEKDTLVNPVVIVEVLSKSTRNYDRGEKFEFYRELTSVREYVTIAQHKPRLEQWTRQDQSHWLLTEFNEFDQSVHLASVDCVLELSEINFKVDWAA